MNWPVSVDRLIAEQERLGPTEPSFWKTQRTPFSAASCFVCFPQDHPGPGARGDEAWAGASLVRSDQSVVTVAVAGSAGAPYEAGLLALREGPLLEAVVRKLPCSPEVLLVNATGRDHPRRTGLAFHLGAILDLPTVGVTHRPLLAVGEWPKLVRGERSQLLLGDERVGYWLGTRSGTRPLAVHAAWRTNPEIALAVVLAASSGKARTPEPIRQARRIAREARTLALRGKEREVV